MDAKTLQLTKQINSIEVTITRNEREALLLENQLIQAQRPRYNIIFRDDKSYPYLWLSTQENYPRLSLYRGPRSESGKFYGPYPSAGDAREALTLLQSIFKLRQCDNTFFKNRARPCLQYQIKRCTAPCVNVITPEAYQQNVAGARLFLEGKSQEVIKDLIEKMERLSSQLQYEEAARIRDQIALLRKVQDHQNAKNVKEADVLGIAKKENIIIIHVLAIREGRLLGSRHYFPDKIGLIVEEEGSEAELLETFILQHYQEATAIPNTILLSHTLAEQSDIEDILSERAARKITLIKPERGEKLKWVAMATLSANKALSARKSLTRDLSGRFMAFKECLKLEMLPQRVECFDISHTLGEATVASCVVFDVNGPLKKEYRRFNIRAATKGDDYAALKEAITRHYTRLKSEEHPLADVLMIDGGKGQLNVAKEVLTELQVAGVVLISVAKGPERKSGLETIFLSENDDIKVLETTPEALNLICEIRDEAHRFAITAHRKQRRKIRLHSSLEEIPGVGKKRRIEILKYFGGLQEVMQASVDALTKVPGLHRALAERIYEALHGS